MSKGLLINTRRADEYILSSGVAKEFQIPLNLSRGKRDPLNHYIPDLPVECGSHALHIGRIGDQGPDTFDSATLSAIKQPELMAGREGQLSGSAADHARAADKEDFHA